MLYFASGIHLHASCQNQQRLLPYQNVRNTEVYLLWRIYEEVLLFIGGEFF